MVECIKASEEPGEAVNPGMNDASCSLCGWREQDTEAGWLPVPGLEGGKLHAQLPPEKFPYCDFP